MAEMRAYLLSLGAGLLVGIVYSLLNVRSPAPPVLALVVLFGILIGEQTMIDHLVDALVDVWRRLNLRFSTTTRSPDDGISRSSQERVTLPVAAQ
jgi:XapX domain-containing protein